MKALKGCIPLQNQIVLTCMKDGKDELIPLGIRIYQIVFTVQQKRSSILFSLNDECYTSKGNLVALIIT